MTTYAVTAATGHLGRLAVAELLRRGVAPAELVAIARTPAKAADIAALGVEVREGDYSRPETLAPALAGIDRLLFISGSEAGRRVAQHANVVAAARTAGVGRIAYTSILKAGATSNPLAPEHQATEQALRESGIPVTFLRNGWYLENYTSQLAGYVARGEILGATGTGRVAGAARADYAAAAAAALLADAPDEAYELGGTPFTFAELAATVSAETGRDVAYRDVTVPELVAALQAAGLDEGTASFVAAIDAAIAAGELDTDSGDLERLLGRPATPLADAVREAKAAL
ncbi:NAD(P)H-binding protein [Motilibacter aurantiacus]|uniref:NAD(P)H-binding protein n=1 Tax=Motilibacter aurantiacus TaxID=2714955 RepID=UPI00140CDFF7|nr:NAD(P)H-binding protein [Motilibacter aurantiacus]NHC46322.1 NAD(P)H-binding protein [Motilibacter aurantiacus]